MPSTLNTITQLNVVHDDGFFVYNALFEKIKEEYGQAIYDNWFTHIKFKALNNQTLSLLAPSKFIREWVISNYFTKIHKILVHFEGVVSKIDIVVDTVSPAPSGVLKSDVSAIEQIKTVAENAIFLDHRFTFDNFTVGQANKMAFNAAQNFANFHSKASMCFNLLYIHGSVGMGKTHLLQAIAHKITVDYPHKSVKYISAEKFMHHYIMSVRSNELINFKESFRHLDVLLFDDLQFICDKNSTQKEFANTINVLLEANKRIVIACDRSPYQLEIDQRTKSRLAGGIAAEIQVADYDLRINVLKQQAASLDAVVTDDIVHFLADNISSNIRELEGALNKLITYCMLNEMPITIETCKNTLKDCLKAHEQDISIAKIIQVVADSNGVTKADILSKSRLAKLVYLRQIVAYISKSITKYSLQEIGKHLGNKDHATVIYYIKQFELKMERAPSLVEEVNNIKKIVQSHIG